MLTCFVFLFLSCQVRLGWEGPDTPRSSILAYSTHARRLVVWSVSHGIRRHGIETLVAVSSPNYAFGGINQEFHCERVLHNTVVDLCLG